MAEQKFASLLGTGHDAVDIPDIGRTSNVEKFVLDVAMEITAAEELAEAQEREAASSTKSRNACGVSLRLPTKTQTHYFMDEADAILRSLGLLMTAAVAAAALGLAPELLTEILGVGNLVFFKPENMQYVLRQDSQGRLEGETRL
ncbi:hypothetical protein EV401DRAFT_1884679 [Pisolithus croceorrhizus]|nr:hypothetical protein EV401DRAFT_1884679 [Pisolithus croceorrhizus]